MLSLERDLEPALALWPMLAGSVPRLVNHSENHTFRLDVPGGNAFALRVHRAQYQSTRNIESELAWLTALRRDTDLPVPEPVPGRDGQVLQSFVTATGEARHAVLFRFIGGSEPKPDSDLVDLFQVLGNYAARLHLHTIGWQRPAQFERQAWSAAAILDPDGLWGDWRVAPGVTPSIRLVLDRVDAALRHWLAQYGTGPDRYGLIHADMRLGNVLVEGDHVSLIDFDDSGLCWFAYDFAAAVSFFETRGNIPDLKSAWLNGYRAIRPVAGDDILAMDHMVMLRRMALLAWIGSHSETSLAQAHMPGFAEGTAMLGERYLGGALWPAC